MPSEPMPCPISREAARVTALHGSLVKTLRLMLRAALPPDQQTAFLEKLPPASRALLDPGTSLPEWVPIPVVIETYQAFESRLGHAPRALFGRLLAEFEAGERLFQPAIQAHDPVAAMRLMPQAWDLFNQGGCLRVADVGPGQATLWTWAWDDFPGIRQEMVSGFVLEALTASGASSPSVEVHPSPLDSFGDRYEVRWD